MGKGISVEKLISALPSNAQHLARYLASVLEQSGTISEGKLGGGCVRFIRRSDLDWQRPYRRALDVPKVTAAVRAQHVPCEKHKVNLLWCGGHCYF